MKATRTGLAQFVKKPPRALKKARVGLVTHAAAVLPDLTHAIDALRSVAVPVAALFAPEHGLSSAAADGAPLEHRVDSRTGLPVFSLYGPTIEPTEEMLERVDVLLFDMQDVGVRFYTYLSTLFYVLRAAGRHQKPTYVLDRPNPITGILLEGGGVEPGFESFVGVVNLPIRHGMTLGELALFLNEEHHLNAEIHVVPMHGWRRSFWFDQTGLLWVPPSPAMPHLSTTILYPGMCLLEGTPLSLGRGTSLPFEICGAPGLDGYSLAEMLNRLQLPGVRFRPVVFTPAASRYAGEECQGVQVHVLQRQEVRPVALAVHLLVVARSLFAGRWKWNDHFDRLTGGSQLRQAIEAEMPAEQIIASWQAALSSFCRVRERYLLY